ncbi:peroxiredoxin [Sphingomonas sp. Leaf357]|uniref:redoxin domain-containing protein n=1 Tax=Sphingomonas sp. Leaf357 TaxID=1736350 RepID=UPI000702178B|nr:redoxin domain-containing protein [Sphingomonas sp. Leaf357]KQS04369.1 peroxiredoxin [Sphingomonas sp. Leaf357]
MRIAPALLAVTALSLATPALAALKVGATAPDIVTKAAKGGKMYDFSLKSALKKGPVVLYFFPAAFTSGCTAEAHEFAEAAAEFEKNGATLIGLTAGNVERIAEFSKVECRDKFPVGAATPAVISGYDVALAAKAGWTDRTSYVIAPNGKIIFTLSQMNPVGHVQGTLDAVKKYKLAKK